MEFGVAYPTGIDANGAIALEYGVRGIPEKFFIDADGIIRRKYVGPDAGGRAARRAGRAAGRDFCAARMTHNALTLMR